MKTWIGALVVAASMAVGTSSRAHQDPPVGYVAGTWLDACTGEPRSHGRCRTGDAHVRCFQVQNPQLTPVGCEISMKAAMSSPTGYERLYTAVEHVLLEGNTSDWLCFSYDELLESTGGHPWRWRMIAVDKPEVSCSHDEGPGAPERDRPLGK